MIFKYKEDLINDFERLILPHFESGHLVPVIECEFRLDDVRGAHEMIESNKNIGKVLLKIAKLNSDEL